MTSHKGSSISRTQAAEGHIGGPSRNLKFSACVTAV